MRATLTFVLSILSLLACASETAMTRPALKSWLPDGDPRAVIVALHSFGDYSAAFDHVGPWYAERGYALFSWDQRGFGANTNAGRWPGADLLEADLLYYLDHLDQRFQAPIYVLGESLGGAVAINVAARYPDAPLNGLILLAPAVREGISMRYGWNIAIGAAALVRPGYLLEVERRPDDPRFRAPSAQRLAQDPLVLRQVRMDAYQGLIRYADRASNIADQLRTPTLLMYGGKDNSVPAVSIERLRRHLADQVEYQFYETGPHLLLQGQHWELVASHTLQWLQRIPDEQTDEQELLFSNAH